MGAWADRDAGHWGDDHGRRARFRELVHGFPWAWDEEVAAGEARLRERPSARLAVARQVAGDALADEELLRDVPGVVGPGRAWWDALDAKVVAAQGAARLEQPARQGQRDVPRAAQRERS